MSRENEENEVMRRTLREVQVANVRARRFGLAAVVATMILVLLTAALTGYNAWLAREQARFNGGIARDLTRYNVDHARQAQDSFQLLLDAQRCTAQEFARVQQGLAALSPEAVAACFPPVPSAPTPPSSEKGPR